MDNAFKTNITGADIRIHVIIVVWYCAEPCVFIILIKAVSDDLTSFLEKRKLESLSELERKFPKPVAKKDEDAAKAFQKGKAESKERKKLLARIDFVEKKVSFLEDEMTEIEKKLASPEENDDILELTRDYLEKKLEKEAFESEWEDLVEKV